MYFTDGTPEHMALQRLDWLISVQSDRISRENKAEKQIGKLFSTTVKEARALESFIALRFSIASGSKPDVDRVETALRHIERLRAEEGNES